MAGWIVGVAMQITAGAIARIRLVEKDAVPGRA
jgi:hypothetical protein